MSVGHLVFPRVQFEICTMQLSCISTIIRSSRLIPDLLVSSHHAVLAKGVAPTKVHSHTLLLEGGLPLPKHHLSLSALSSSLNLSHFPFVYPLRHSRHSIIPLLRHRFDLFLVNEPTSFNAEAKVPHVSDVSFHAVTLDITNRTPRSSRTKRSLHPNQRSQQFNQQSTEHGHRKRLLPSTHHPNH